MTKRPEDRAAGVTDNKERIRGTDGVREILGYKNAKINTDRKFIKEKSKTLKLVFFS